MQQIPGQREGSVRFIHDGHVYHHDSRYDNASEEYVCSYRTSRWQCRVTASISPHGDVVIYGTHEHAPRHPLQEVRRQEMIVALRRQALLSTASPDQIFNNVSARFVINLLLV